MFTRRPSRSNLHDAVDQGVERVVVSLADIPAGMEAVADLPDEDVAGDDLLAAEPLDAPLLRLRIAAVAAGTLAFFMCHDELLRRAEQFGRMHVGIGRKIDECRNRSKFRLAWHADFLRIRYVLAGTQHLRRRAASFSGKSSGSQ